MLKKWGNLNWHSTILIIKQKSEVEKVVQKKGLKCTVPIAIPLHTPETKRTFLPLLHDYFHYLLREDKLVAVKSYFKEKSDKNPLMNNQDKLSAGYKYSY